jgi:hypothetical protein
MHISYSIGLLYKGLNGNNCYFIEAYLDNKSCVFSNNFVLYTKKNRNDLLPGNFLFLDLYLFEPLHNVDIHLFLHDPLLDFGRLEHVSL